MKKLFVIILLIVLCLPVPCLWATEDHYTTIIEKNLFHPDRKKWILEGSNAKEKLKVPKPKKNLSHFELMGTIIVGDHKRAVVKTSEKASGEGYGTYMVGDYIEGYLLKEIYEKRVVLSVNAGEDVTIFLNEGKAHRAALKTEIKEEPHLSVQLGEKTGAKQVKYTSSKKKKRVYRRKADTARQLKERLRKDLRVLKAGKSRLMGRQAEKDFKKLQKLMPFMSDEERREAIELRRELDRLNKRK